MTYRERLIEVMAKALKPWAWRFDGLDAMYERDRYEAKSLAMQALAAAERAGDWPVDCYRVVTP